jgi:hypothetical protein
MGQYFFLSGGVSLASRNDIRSKLLKRKTAARPAVASRKTARQEGRAPAAKAKAASSASSPAVPAAKNYERAQTGRGSFSAKKQGNTMTLAWQKSSREKMSDYVDGLVRLQEQKAPGYKDETLFSSCPDVEAVVRLAPGKAYLVKNKTLNGAWIQLALNDQSKSGAGSIRASGTEPDADIFSAKLLSSRRAEQLLAQKGSTTIFAKQ